MSEFTHQIAVTVSDGVAKVTEAIHLSEARLRDVGGDVEKQAREIGKHVQSLLSDAARGKIDQDVAQEALDRELGALAHLARALVDAAAKEAVKNYYLALSVAKDVAIVALKVGVTLAVGAL